LPEQQALANQIQAARAAPLPAAELAAIPLLPAPVVQYALAHHLEPSLVRPGYVDARGIPNTSYGEQNGHLVIERNGRIVGRVYQ
jgi:hypothetical protein